MNQCKHGLILYGTKCLNCEREKKEKLNDDEKRESAIKKIREKADKLDW